MLILIIKSRLSLMPNFHGYQCKTNSILNNMYYLKKIKNLITKIGLAAKPMLVSFAIFQKSLLTRKTIDGSTVGFFPNYISIWISYCFNLLHQTDILIFPCTGGLPFFVTIWEKIFYSCDPNISLLDAIIWVVKNSVIALCLSRH